ncbi:MAG TPA: hypothetical protein VGQ83_38240 [Polyangia bacterium]|jgi:hypothetical protein
MPPSTRSLPAGVETLLGRAAVDAALAARLLAERDGAAAAAGVALTPSERALLRATPAAQLERMIARLRPPLERREFLRRAGGGAVLLLGGAALGAGLGPAPARATPPQRPMPPAGIRPALPWFEGEVELVRYRTLAGPGRALPDETIERDLAVRGVRGLPRHYEGTLKARLEVDREGRVTRTTAFAPGASGAAIEELKLALARTTFRPARERTTLAFDVELSPRRPARPWSGALEVGELDVIGTPVEPVRRGVRGVVPRALAFIVARQGRDRPHAGKVRYTFRIDPAGVPEEPQLTRNTTLVHHVAMSLRQLFADLRFPKAVAWRWCRVTLVLPPAEHEADRRSR